MFTITGITSIVITFIVRFKKGQWWQKGIYSRPFKSNFRCQFVYTLHGVLAKIIFRSCVTRDGAICIKNGTFEYFDGTNPITWKGVSNSILQRFWLMLVLLVADLCMYLETLWKFLLPLSTLPPLPLLFCMHLILPRPLVSYNLKQKPWNTLENYAPFVICLPPPLSSCNVVLAT